MPGNSILSAVKLFPLILPSTYTFLITLIFGLNFSFETVKNLDIERFMGKWYVIAAIPTFVEKNCENAYDIYTLNEDGTVDIKYFADKNGSPFTISQKGTIIDENIYEYCPKKGLIKVNGKEKF